MKLIREKDFIGRIGCTSDRLASRIHDGSFLPPVKFPNVDTMMLPKFANKMQFWNATEVDLLVDEINAFHGGKFFPKIIYGKEIPPHYSGGREYFSNLKELNKHLLEMRKARYQNFPYDESFEESSLEWNVIGRKELLELTSFSMTFLNSYIAAGMWPNLLFSWELPRKFHVRKGHFWIDRHVDGILAAIMGGASTEEIKQIVCKFEKERLSFRRSD